MSKDLTVMDKQSKYDDAKAIVVRLVNTGAKVNIELPKTLDAQKAWALNKYDEHLKTGLQMGYALHVINTQIEDGEFKSWLAANNIKQSTAYQYIQVAKFVAKLDPQSDASDWGAR